MDKQAPERILEILSRLIREQSNAGDLGDLSDIMVKYAIEIQDIAESRNRELEERISSIKAKLRSSIDYYENGKMSNAISRVEEALKQIEK